MEESIFEGISNEEYTDLKKRFGNEFVLKKIISWMGAVRYSNPNAYNSIVHLAELTLLLEQLVRFLDEFNKSGSFRDLKDVFERMSNIHFVLKRTEWKFDYQKRHNQACERGLI